MYVSVKERVLMDHQRGLREAQEALACARRCNSPPEHVARCEQHVLRMLNYVWIAQKAVWSQTKARKSRLWLTAALHEHGNMEIIGAAYHA